MTRNPSRINFSILGSDRELDPFRVIAILGAPLTIMYGELRLRIDPEIWDPLVLRLLISSSLIFILISSYFLKRKYVKWMIWIFFYLATIWVASLSAVNDIYGYTANLIVAIALGMIAVFREFKALTLYAIFSIVSSIGIRLIVEPRPERLLFVIDLIVSVAVLYLVSITSIRAQKRANDEMISVSVMKDNIIDTLADQVRKPLSRILLSVGELMGDKSDVNTQISNILTTSTDLIHIVDQLDLLKNYLSNNVGFEPRWVRLDSVCEVKIKDIANEHDNSHTIELELEAIENNFDVKLFKQMISSLLSNAIKFSLSGTLINIRLRSVGEQIVLEVEDHGIGVLSGDIEQIFEPFRRGQNAGKRPGLGLGLTIAREAAKLHRGNISLTCKEEGTIFTVVIPIQPAEEQTS